MTRLLTKESCTGIIQASRGEVLRIEVEETPATAYLWHLSTGNGMLVVASEFRPLHDAKTGGGGKRSFLICGEKSGLHQIELLLHRPWEDQSTAVERINFQIIIH